MRHSSCRLALLTVPLALIACQPHPASRPSTEKERAPKRPAPISKTPTPTPSAVRPITVSLKGKQSVPVPGTDLQVVISEAWHKTRAPLVGVSVLVSRGPKRKAQVGWRIESGKVPVEWKSISGRRYDGPTGKYVEETIPGWQIRMVTLDDSNAGGSPSAITVSFRRTPR